MSRKSEGYRIVVEVDGNQRQILSLSATANNIGTLIIGTMPGARYSTTLEEKGDAVKDRKISLHPNIEPPYDPMSNHIHETIELVDLPKIHFRSDTKAIKTTKCFAPLMVKACSDPRSATFDLGPASKKKIVNLGAFDPSTCVLMMALLASPPDMEVKQTSLEQDYKIASMPFEKYMITLLYYVFPLLRSVSMSPSLNVETENGLTQAEITPFFNVVRGELLKKLVEMHQSSHANKFDQFGPPSSSSRDELDRLAKAVKAAKLGF